MAVVTIHGQFGARGFEIGAEAARRLGAEYVDRAIIAQEAQRIGATIEAVEEKERRGPTMGDRIARILRRLAQSSAVMSPAGDPYVGAHLDALLTREYTEASREPISSADELDDREFIRVTRAVIEEIAQTGNVVIVGRGSNIILHEMPGALHVGLVAHLANRIQNVMLRETIGQEQATRMVHETERGRVAYFRKFFKVHPDDPAWYHLVLNTGHMEPPQAAAIIERAAKELGTG